MGVDNCGHGCSSRHVAITYVTHLFGTFPAAMVMPLPRNIALIPDLHVKRCLISLQHSTDVVEQPLTDPWNQSIITLKEGRIC